ncbi:MAG: GGDEF domain-containing protein [Ruminococcaceae bacterium]|nr:GGDEF domain-containing protein [Oscillospiraceae bacterium]
MKIVTFDYAALILLIVLLISTVIRKMTKGNSNHVFLFILFTMLAATGFDIWALLMDNACAGSMPARYASHSGYLLFHNLTTPAYLMYVISLADTWHKLRKNILQQALIVAPLLLLIGLLTANLFTNCLFYFDNGEYIHGPLFMILYCIAAYYMIFGLILLMLYRGLISRLKILAIGSIVPLVVVAIAIQFVNANNVVEMFANSLSLLFISATAQRPEEIIDPQTGLGNYGSYAEYTKRSFKTDKHISIIMLHVANFTRLQNMISYDTSAELLGRITHELVDADRIYRCGGELFYLDRGRFRIILWGKNRKRAGEIAEYLRVKLSSENYSADLPVVLSLHFCVVECPEDIKDFKSLTAFGSGFHEKEYESSERVLFASELFKNNRFEMMNNIDSIIDNALRNNSFKVYYQPIFNVEKNRFSTAEALLRLIDDKYGFVPPDMFIAAAEKNGAIHKIGDFVLEEVCRFIASDRFKELGIDYIEINLSVAQCMHSDLADKVLAMLEKYNISSDKINLEITETAAARAHNEMKNNLDKLSDAGINFSLDDYGTGYSNMRRVIQLPLKIVKLDKSFVDEQHNPKMWIVLQNTVKMLKDMNMEIVVEGIETEKMVEQFTALSCDYIQGYYYSKPIPEDEFVDFVRKAHEKC